MVLYIKHRKFKDVRIHYTIVISHQWHIYGQFVGVQVTKCANGIHNNMKNTYGQSFPPPVPYWPTKTDFFTKNNYLLGGL